MVTNPSLDLVLEPVLPDAGTPSTEGQPPRPLSSWLTTFHLVSIVVDPYTNESSWILPTATRILRAFSGSAARSNFIVTSSADEARQFLGPLSREFLVFADPERSAVRSLGLESLPAFVFIQSDGTVPAVAQGWDAASWRAVAKEIATTTAWTAPLLPLAGDPASFAGTPALG